MCRDAGVIKQHKDTFSDNLFQHACNMLKMKVEHETQIQYIDMI